MSYPEFIYENTRRISYDLEDGQGIAWFLPVCTNCGRYVKMDKTIKWNESKGFKDQPNANCRKCGRIKIDCELID